jgi:WD40 repeat protein
VVIVATAATAAAVLGTVLALRSAGSQSPGTGSAVAGSTAGQHVSTPAAAGAPSPDAAASSALPTSATASLTATLADPYGIGVASLAFGPGHTLAEGNADGGTYVWDTSTKSVIGSHAGYTFRNGAGNELVEAAGVAFGPNGILAIANGATYLWNTGTQAVTGALGSDDDSDTKVAFSPDSIVAVPGGPSTSMWTAIRTCGGS